MRVTYDSMRIDGGVGGVSRSVCDGVRAARESSPANILSGLRPVAAEWVLKTSLLSTARTRCWQKWPLKR